MTLARRAAARPGRRRRLPRAVRLLGQSPRRVRLRERYSQRPAASDLADARRHRTPPAVARRPAGALGVGHARLVLPARLPGAVRARLAARPKSTASPTSATGCWKMRRKKSCRSSSNFLPRPIPSQRIHHRAHRGHREEIEQCSLLMHCPLRVSVSCGELCRAECSMSESFSVRIAKAEHVFSAAHFITFGGQCERLHGHNYHVAAEIVGPLDEDSPRRRFPARPRRSSAKSRRARSLRAAADRTSANSRRGRGRRSDGHVREPPLGVSQRRLPAAAGGQHDGRAAGRLHRQAAASWRSNAAAASTSRSSASSSTSATARLASGNGGPRNASARKLCPTGNFFSSRSRPPRRYVERTDCAASARASSLLLASTDAHRIAMSDIHNAAVLLDDASRGRSRAS